MPSQSRSKGWPMTPLAATRIFAARITSSGAERQLSSTMAKPDFERTSGLTETFGIEVADGPRYGGIPRDVTYCGAPPMRFYDLEDLIKPTALLTLQYLLRELLEIRNEVLNVLFLPQASEGHPRPFNNAARLLEVS